MDHARASRRGGYEEELLPLPELVVELLEEELDDELDVALEAEDVLAPESEDDPDEELPEDDEDDEEEDPEDLLSARESLR